MQFGTITGRILATIADRVQDPDVNPDVVPVGGTVRFTPSVTAAISSSEGAIIMPTPIEATLDSEGYLSVNGQRGVSLVATDSADLNPSGFTYTVSFIGLKFDKFDLTYASFSIAVPADSTQDLSTLTPVGSSNGTIIIRGAMGESGPSAYDAWVALGNTGTLDDFIASLKGTPGAAGVNAVAESLGAPPPGPFYDAKHSLYNYKPRHLRAIRAAIARSEIGQGSAKIMFVGDSNTLGLGPLLVDGDVAAYSYAARFRDIAAKRGMAVAGDGVLFPAQGGDSRLTGSGAVGQVNPLLQSLDNGASLTFTPTLSNSAFVVTYLNAFAGSFNVTIDGATTSITRAASGGFAQWASPAMAMGKHVITVAAPAGGSAHIASIEAATFTSGFTGLRIAKAGVSGSTAADWVSGGYPYLGISETFGAHLVTIMLGTNDAQNSTLSAWTAAITEMVAAYRADGADVMLIAPPARQEIDMTPWWQAVYGLALQLDVPLLDLRDRQGPYSVAGGYFVDRAGDTVHLSSQGHDDLARALLDVVM